MQDPYNITKLVILVRWNVFWDQPLSLWAFPLGVGGAPTTFKGKALGTRLVCLSSTWVAILRVSTSFPRNWDFSRNKTLFATISFGFVDQNLRSLQRDKGEIWGNSYLFSCLSCFWWCYTNRTFEPDLKTSFPGSEEDRPWERVGRQLLILIREEMFLHLNTI